MPIKLPKGFPRRKSSGNALDEIPNPPEPSFRVFERPESRSFDGGTGLKRMSQGRPLSAGHIERDGKRNNANPTNRGSGGTDNSNSSGGHDNSSSSARFSSSSTLPSSTDVPLDDRSYPKGPYKMPTPPIPESTGAMLRGAGRKFSFSRKKAEAASTPGFRPAVEHAQSDGRAGYMRERAMTESSYASESTATPPKLLDTGLEFGDSSLDNLESVFESFGKRRSQLNLGQATLGFGNTGSPEIMLPAGTGVLTEPYGGKRSDMTPPPLNVDRTSKAMSSPRSQVSHDSEDALMAPQDHAMERTFSYENGQESLRTGHGLPKSRTMPLPGTDSPPHRQIQQRPPSTSTEGLQKSGVYAAKRDSARESTLFHDADARLVMDSISASRRLDRNSGVMYHDSDEEDNPRAGLVSNPSYPSPSYTTSRLQQNAKFDGRPRSAAPVSNKSDQGLSNSWLPSSVNITPQAKTHDISLQDERSMFDTSSPIIGRAVPPRSRTEPPPVPRTQNKIMTKAQFERYRKEIAMTGHREIVQDVSDEEDEYEDDDETEHNKQLARQRRKQEAHLAVYRQQMMKVTGEPSDLPNMQFRPSAERASMSSPNLQDRSTTPSISFDKPADGSRISDDEDEDVPLGVLAAHGFPSKNRPPSAMDGVDSKIRYQSESYPPPPVSTKANAGPGRAGGLPPFAKNLPQDPYYGASLVNPSNRESLAFGHSGASSAYGGPQPSMPPGGLVGVIAGEERARASRRGSPNAQGHYSSPLPPSMIPAMGMPPGMPPMMTPGEQATVHMSEQMTQMMQMQMQWMQQMQQMMTMQPGQQPQTPFAMPPQQMMPHPGMLAPPSQQQRPMSTGSPSGLGIAPRGQSRAMSMLGPPPTHPWPPSANNRLSVAPSMMSGALGGSGPGYTPSIAPSERSNVGMPSRYRPVSIAPADERAPNVQSRASTFTSGTLQAASHGRDSVVSTSADRDSKPSLRPVSRTPPPKLTGSDDEEEGWEEMKKKREKKKSTWRLKKKKEDNLDLDVYDFPEL